ncbi:AfsR/SARP family transcriptional regulator [Streptomyces lasiicapitis]|uniref:AfsR/SARP family transcriptional regulator n=1 Tax=Streptomyces lasiicapitis TaxID=1923961 RepID=UPI00367BC184
MEFRALGHVEAVGAAGAVPRGRPKPRTVLACLLLSANTPVPTDRLCEMLWAGNPPASARANVRSYAARLRRALNAASDGDRLSPGHQGYLLRVQQGELDMRLFDELVARGRAALADGDQRSAAEQLRTALDLWRGGPRLGGGPHDPRALRAGRRVVCRCYALDG